MGQQIELQAADGHCLSAYAAGPDDCGKGLVVVQEIFGVNSHMRRVCDRFAGHGYRVIAPALFDRTQRGVELGYTDADLQRGLALRAEIPEAGTLADIEAAARALPDTAHAGIIGFCWGGTIAWWGATRSTLFRAAIGWYGGGIAAARDERPRCPVQLHFGEADHAIPMPDVNAIRAAQPDADIHVYPGVGHGFGCEDRGSYDQAATEQAEQRSLAFLQRYL